MTASPLDDILPPPDTTPLELTADTGHVDRKLARLIALGLILIGGLLLGGLLAVAALADIPTEARVAALATVSTAAAGALGSAAALLTRTH